MVKFVKQFPNIETTVTKNLDQYIVPYWYKKLIKQKTKRLHIIRERYANRDGLNQTTSAVLDPSNNFTPKLNIYYHGQKQIGSELVSIQTPTWQGGCDTRVHSAYDIITNDDNEILGSVFYQSYKSKNNNCAFIAFKEFLGIKRGETPDKIRSKLGFQPKAEIKVDDMIKLVDYYQCDVAVWQKLEDRFDKLLETNKFNRRLELYLKDNHYFKVVRWGSKYIICEKCNKEAHGNHKCDFLISKSRS